MQRLEARHVSKTFGSTKVLDDVDLSVEPGEIHALVGQNGSGKSTLVKILTGYHSPDAGASLAVDGQLLQLPVQWREAADLGISVVHQDLGLLDQLTVSDNIGVGGYHHSRFLRRIDWRRSSRRSPRTCSSGSTSTSTPRPRSATLGAARRAEVAIARALRDQRRGAGLIVLDEATRALPREELEQVPRAAAPGGRRGQLRAHGEPQPRRGARAGGPGHGSPRRQGRRCRRYPPSSSPSRRWPGSCSGRPSARWRRAPSTGPTIPWSPACPGLSGEGLQDVEIEVREGEVVGLTGLPGSGFEAIPYLVTGARRARTGRLRTRGGDLDLARSDVAACMAAGVALVPERRDRDGLAVELDVSDNIALPSVRSRGRPWFVARALAAPAGRRPDRAACHPRPQLLDLVKELSGGNQQKVLFAKWLSVEPSLLVLHEADAGRRRRCSPGHPRRHPGRRRRRGRRAAT